MFTAEQRDHVRHRVLELAEWDATLCARLKPLLQEFAAP
jgi:hypothetical protein